MSRNSKPIKILLRLQVRKASPQKPRSSPAAAAAAPRSFFPSGKLRHINLLIEPAARGPVRPSPPRYSASSLPSAAASLLSFCA